MFYIGKESLPLHDFSNNRKLNLGYIMGLNVKVNVLEEKIRELLYDFDTGMISFFLFFFFRNDFLNRAKTTLTVTKISLKSLHYN